MTVFVILQVDSVYFSVLSRSLVHKFYQSLEPFLGKGVLKYACWQGPRWAQDWPTVGPYGGVSLIQRRVQGFRCARAARCSQHASLQRLLEIHNTHHPGVGRDRAGRPGRADAARPRNGLEI